MANPTKMNDLGVSQFKKISNEMVSHVCKAVPKTSHMN